jgi:hypothetical protein
MAVLYISWDITAYLKNKGIVETNAKRAYELDEEKRSQMFSLALQSITKELYKIMIKISTLFRRCESKQSFWY